MDGRTRARRGSEKIVSQQKPTILTAIRRIAIVAAILIAFVVGLAGTVYLSLRSPEVKVPEVVGQHYLAGQNALESAGLNIRRRAKRFKGDAKPDTILDQSPRAGEVVKKGQTVAVVTADENSGKEIPVETPEPAETPSGKPQNANNTNAAPRNENQNRDQRNRNSNRNTNRNGNANNRNANNQNNSNRNANQNSNRNANANNRNAGNRNANANGSRNTNANRSTPTLNINRPNSNAPVRPNSNNANRRTP